MSRPHNMLDSSAQALPYGHSDSAPQPPILAAQQLELVSADLSPDTERLDPQHPGIDAPDSTTTGSSSRRRQQPDPQRPGQFLAWSKRYVASLVALDALAGMLAVLCGPALPRAMYFTGLRQVLLVLAGGVAWTVGISAARGYERARIGVGGDELRAVLRAGVFLVAAGGVASVMFVTHGVSALVILGTPIAGFASIAVRFTARKVLHHQQRQGRNVRKVIIVGSAYAAADLATVLEREVHAGMQVLGVCLPSADMERAREAGLLVLGELGQVPQLIQDYNADAVAVTGGDATRHNYLRELSWALEGAGVELLVHPGLIEVAGPRMHIRPYVGLPLLHVEQPHFTGWRRFVKRAADISFTSIGLVIASPVLLLIAAAIKLSDGGPVIFKQTRVGLDGSTFTLFKFRSMHVDAEARLAELRAQNPGMGTMFKLVDDPRITRVGRVLRRFSLDELPQLVNVLAGAMSLVGPRPPLQSEVDQYEDHARRRLLVTPGLTGLWQVSGRSLLSWEETVRLDLRYIENWTLTLDLLIMWKTFFAVVAKRGAF
jgi:exopolysaccharide biosynthesis polyprenyl glycosylphosphotransferase